MTLHDNKALWLPWGELWTGNLALAADIISPDFVGYYVPMTGGGPAQMHGPQELTQWIQGIHGIMPDLTFTTELGPFCEGDMLIGRWKAQGTSHGGMFGVPSSPIGRRIEFTGTDTLHIVNGKIAEWWGNADSLYLMQQLGVVPPLG